MSATSETFSVTVFAATGDVWNVRAFVSDARRTEERVDEITVVNMVG